ncbi:MAG TPA: methyltransferase domain-containing protein [Acidimicrobiia bacterium]
MSAIYDRLGVGYARHRRPDPRVAAQIDAALGDACTVLNVGAGAGSYEPTERAVTAVEPSSVMVHQRAPNAAPAVRAVAERLPFADATFDAALASLTIHHWPDWRAGIGEMRRVTRGPIVVFHFEVGEQGTFWLTRDYLPDAVTIPAPAVDEVVDALRGARVDAVPIPADCTDGFFCAYWGRPEAYLDPDVRAAISVFHLLDPAVCERAVAQLRADLESGAWDERHGHLRDLDALDVGYRLVVATP